MAMRKIRVLIVDDAVVIRRMLTEVLSGDPQLEVVGTAANGNIALARIPQLNPDVLTLDIEMPEMDGLETLAALRKSYASLPVIMFSTLTERGAAKTLDALALGANDYITKPANVGSVSHAIQRIREGLIPKIKMFCSSAAGIDPPPEFPKAISTSPHRVRALPVSGPSRVDIVAIGVSTGGPNALAAVFPAFPADFPVPVVVVQHMPPVFTRILAERLESCSELRVEEARAGELLRPGRAWIAPGGYHMVVDRQNGAACLQTNQAAPENSCRPAVDVLFRSVAGCYGRSALGVILTGMGYDGLRGSEQIRTAGGQILVQDEATSVVWGMPGCVAEAGLADRVLPQDQIGSEITRRVMNGRLASLAKTGRLQ